MQRRSRARVAEGAVFLDRVRPGWPQEIDPDTLDIGSPNRCVVGQLEGEYNTEENRKQLGIESGEMAASLGLAAEMNSSEYPDLTQAWLEERAKRLAPSEELAGV